ncbi:ion transporter [Rhypophila decipiens]|uniref:Voltage-gated hydrogen channel 1 n=1 Tax=Rhypophila decipiens TaxID=261697 RepID=A0AAN6Y1V9_9PEZI|nr:ion transporter [Rhypophila decipiens]
MENNRNDTTSPSSNDDNDDYGYFSSREPLLAISNQAQIKNREGQKRTREVLESKPMHYVILGLVALDVTAILADIFITLIACDLGKKDEEWIEWSEEILYFVGLVFSSLFLVELMASVWVFGTSFFKDWFHCFDAFIIITSFVVDILTRGIVEQIASLVIILRLWRLVKIVEELSVGASEQMEEIEAKVVELEAENTDLKMELARLRNGDEVSDGEL